MIRSVNQILCVSKRENVAQAHQRFSLEKNLIQHAACYVGFWRMGFIGVKKQTFLKSSPKPSVEYRQQKWSQIFLKKLSQNTVLLNSAVFHLSFQSSKAQLLRRDQSIFNCFFSHGQIFYWNTQFGTRIDVHEHSALYITLEKSVLVC